MRRLKVRQGHLIAIAIAAFGVGAATLSLHRARAAGIPPTGAMTYSGLLLDSSGAPLTGSTHTVEVKLWASATTTTVLCDTGSPTASTPLTAGRFSVQLPDTCTTSIAGSNSAFAEVILDGTSLGRMALGAVPYAVEANHSVSADTAANASGALATSIASLQSAAHPASGFHADLSQNLSVDSSHATTIVFDHVSFDLAKEYNTDGTFKPSNPGYYLLTCACEYPQTTSGFLYQANLYKNGSRLALSEISASVADGTTATATTFASLVKGDVITCVAWQDSGAATNLDASWTSFSAARLY